MRYLSSLFAAILVLMCAANTGFSQDKGADGALVLNEQAYVRQFLTFGLERFASRPLKEDVDKWSKDAGGRSGLSAIEKATKKLLAGRGIDWNTTDWRDVAVFHFSRTQCGVDERGAMMLPAIWPAANWSEVDFDDSQWLCQRLGRLTPNRLGAVAYDMNSLLYRGSYYRTCFVVPDPDKAQDLTVSIRYRGGARILVNGKEIARASLPAGQLDENSHGDDYPLEAYVAKDDEVPEAGDGRRKAADGIADLRCDWDEMGGKGGAKPAAFKTDCMGQELNQKGWERIQKLRDRALGPVKIPANLLKKGINVLAVEARTSFYHAWVIPSGQERRWTAHGGYTNLSWDHCGLVRLEMRSPSSAVPSMLSRPAGVQVWASDMHNRLFGPDYKPLSGAKDMLRFVGACNGTFSAQIGLSTDRELTGLKASASDLAGPATAGSAVTSDKGGKIAASAIQIMPMQGQPIYMLNYLGEGRCEKPGFNPTNPRIGASTAELALHRYQVLANVPRAKNGQVDPKDLLKAYTDFQFFDHITAAWPEKVPANMCQPLWVYLRIPADAAPGVYTGTVRVQADGVAPMSLPVRAEVVGWRVPAPREFQTFVESEQSPYGVAKYYEERSKIEDRRSKEATSQGSSLRPSTSDLRPSASTSDLRPAFLWSDRHFELMESSFRQLGRLGNNWLFVPVLIKSELGNKDDMMIRWTRKKDGSLAFDYSIMDRYLALAQKYQRTKVICFMVMHGAPSNSNAVRIVDEATGQTETVEIGPAQGATRRPYWLSFARSLYDHMKGLNLADVMYWGQAFDDVPDKGLVGLLAEAVPDVYWTCAGHGRGPDTTFRSASRAYGVDLGGSSLRGWNIAFYHLLMPRAYGSVICVEGTSTAFSHRVLVDRAIYTGFNGIGRMGADYFLGTWMDGFASNQWNMVGRSSVQTLWPGKDGVEASTRHEAMLEGVQESEARIFLEQALERGGLPEDLAKEVQKVLDLHCHETLYVPGGAASVFLMDYTSDWQGRSRRLFGAAAKVAQKIGLDVNRTAFGEVPAASRRVQSPDDAKVSVPALGKARLALKLRNWSDKPRAYKAVSGDAWIAPEKLEGTIMGHQELGIILDGKALKIGAEATGTLTVTDVAAGTAYPVTIVARVDKPIDLKWRQDVFFISGGGSGAEMPKPVHIVLEPVFNVPVSGSDAKEYLLVSQASEKQPWKVESSVPWLKAEPAGGEIAPGATIRVKIVAAPPDKASATYEPVLTFSAAGGAVKDECKVRTYVIPAYQKPAAVPTGAAVYLNDLDQGKFVKSHMDNGFSKTSSDPKTHRVVGDNPMPVYHRYGRVEVGNPTDIRKEDFATSPFTMAKKSFTHGLWVYPSHETVYNIEGAGFAAFAAEVGFYDKLHGYANRGAVVSFEVYVDGKPAAQSGLMKVGDEPRLLVVTGLEKAKEIKLVTRRDDLVNDRYCVATWGDPRFIKAK